MDMLVYYAVKMVISPLHDIHKHLLILHGGSELLRFTNGSPMAPSGFNLISNF
jgi:hypothetical protein